MRFPMTTDRTVKLITALTFVVVLITVPIPLVLFSIPHVPSPVAWASTLVGFGVPVILVLTVLWAPRAVRLENGTLIVERLAWSDVRIPLTDISLVEAGPELKIMGGGAGRVAGNGGLMGFTGLFKVAKGGAIVRCWATRLDSPTVLVHRKSERPVLLGVDDSAGLLQALRTSVT